jgi:hypothetical protein
VTHAANTVKKETARAEGSGVISGCLLTIQTNVGQAGIRQNLLLFIIHQIHGSRQRAVYSVHAESCVPHGSLASLHARRSSPSVRVRESQLFSPLLLRRCPLWSPAAPGGPPVQEGTTTRYDIRLVESTSDGDVILSPARLATDYWAAHQLMGHLDQDFGLWARAEPAEPRQVTPSRPALGGRLPVGTTGT